MAIDSHIHLYPPSVSADPLAWAVTQNEPYWLSCVKPSHGKSLQAWKSPSELLQDMDDAGVEKVVILSWYWENHDSCLHNLNWQTEWLAKTPHRFICFAPFNANGGSAALELLKNAFQSGCKGIGELNPPAQGYAYEDPVLAQALELAAAYRAPVNFHVTDPTTHDYPGKIDTPYASLLNLANEHPNTSFIFSHLGGCEPLRNREPPPNNVVFDTAACPLLYKTPVYREFCDKVGVDKILFGSDYPLRVFPKDKRSPNFILPLAELQNGDLSPAEIEAITLQNAKRLFHLS
ncbi:amidohydrolase family protein [Pelagicoccus enzymogenes]|uniref:amidohydrolase family protein n=1 Tax=Pelagicoccus enzymogenes TaxID=2773457 RepID=UPI00280D6237|nr:amidohydrolase family protein [Pelagicoccus enzymogenes]MDQ8197165.1 amidohydrolase family protein [Pelagicoccus enzymogenes]